MPVDLTKEIAAFERDKERLSDQKAGRWVVYLNEELKGDFPSFSSAMEFSMAKFPQADFLVRQVGAPEPQLPFLMVVA